MSLICIQHQRDKRKMIVNEKLAQELLASGRWFRTEVKNEVQKEIQDEKQIRQHAREGINDCKQPPKEAGSRARRKKPIREEDSS